MEKIKGLFFNIDFTWKKVILFSIVTAVFTAVLNLIPFTEGTSFRDPAATTDVWILFALVIIMNCKSYKEAAVKTFVFFVISQPLIYLIEVPFLDEGWSVFGYYTYWGIITIATIPGSVLAYRVKQQDNIAAVILSLATGLLMITAVEYIMMTPVHVISIIFCTVLSVVLILTLLSERKQRVIALVLTVVMIAAYSVSIISRPPPVSMYLLDQSHQWEITSETDESLDAKVEDGFRLVVSPEADGEYDITVKDESGDEQVLQVLVKNDAQNVDIEPVE